MLAFKPLCCWMQILGFQTANLTEVELVLGMCCKQSRRLTVDKLISFLNRSSSGSLNKWKRSRDS